MKLALKPRLSQLSELSDEDLGAFQLELVEALSELSDQDSAAAIGELQALQVAAGMVDRAFSSRQTVTADAGASQVQRMAARQGRPARSPEAGRPRGTRPVLTASAAMRNIEPGKAIENRDELAVAVAATLQGMRRDGPPRGDVIVASARTHYPEDRRLTDSPEHNARIMDAVTSPAALTATGGICLPVNVDYAVPVFATQDRPLRDGLPAFEASRGGLRYVSTPDIGQWAAATGIWTEATDASPGAATKPVVSMPCGTEQLVYVEAISTRIGFGNMQSRFAPEQVAANMDLAMAAAARVAENNLLNLLAAVCVPGVTSAVALGATRDLLTAINQVCAGYRSLHRIPRSQALTAIFPDWVRDLIRVDLARELAHGNTSEWNSLAISDEQVEAMLQAHGIKPIFHYDGQPNSVSGGVAQIFPAQTGTGAVNPFPAKCVWYLFAEGQIQFLDGGRLDLGVVRDSALDASNDFEVMVETFETLAFRGFNAGALQLVSSLCASGLSAAGTTSTTCA